MKANERQVEQDCPSVAEEWAFNSTAGPTYTPISPDVIDRMVVDSRPQSRVSKAKLRNHVRQLLRERAFLLIELDGVE